MKKILTVLTILFLMSIFCCSAQQINNPRQYFDYINQAELAICDSNYTDAIKNYKFAFQYLKEPFGEDLFNYFHCGLIVEDKEIIYTCITKYKERNYLLPFWMEDYRNKIIGKYTDSLYLNLQIQSRIDTGYRSFIINLHTQDQNVRRSSNPKERDILKTDSTNISLFKHYVDSTGIFPTEAIIGNEGNVAFTPLPFEIILIHYAADVGMLKSFKKPINLELDKKVLLGEFPPDLYAHLCDSRGYGIDGKLKKIKPTQYGADMYISVKKKGNKTFDISDKSTWQQTLNAYEDLTPKQEKELNDRRRTMNMEPYQDLIRKIRYQMNLNNAQFQLVNTWFVATIFE